MTFKVKNKYKLINIIIFEERLTSRRKGVLYKHLKSSAMLLQIKFYVSCF